MKVRNQIICVMIIILISPLDVGSAIKIKECRQQPIKYCHQNKPFFKSAACPLKQARRKINQFAKEDGNAKYFWKSVDHMMYAVD